MQRTDREIAEAYARRVVTREFPFLPSDAVDRLVAELTELMLEEPAWRSKIQALPDP